MLEPKFKHDCDKCEFLGHFFDHDVYTCKRSLIARWADGPGDYASTELSHFLDLIRDRRHRISGHGIEGSPPFQDYVFSSSVTKYHKAWLIALACTTFA